MTTGRVLPRALGAACAALLALGASGVEGQVRMRNSDTALLREAANLESRGDLDGAETVLRRLLGGSPTSSGGIFALERVLRAKGELGDLLDPVDRFLEQEPSSSGVRYLKLRVLAEVDSLSALRSEAERWIASDPGDEVPYREVARVYERAYGPAEALELLRRGRAAAGRPDALALEMGDMLAAQGDVDGAVAEWALATGDDAAQAVTVTRRVQGLEEAAPEAGKRLVSLLAGSGVPARRRAAARIALDLGLAEEALALSQEVAAGLDDRAKASFIADVARRAREQELTQVAAWAYDELSAEAASPADRRSFDLRLVEVSLATGDTAAALEAQRRLSESYPQGSVDRRRAAAQLIRLEGRRSDPSELRELLDAFRADFPDAPELDELSAIVASAMSANGDAEAAVAVLGDVEGPQSSLERGYLLLAEGNVTEGRSALLLAVTGLPPSEATPVIQFAGLLGRVSEEGAALLAEAAVEAHRGRGADAARSLAVAVDSLPPEEQAPVLAEAARMAERGGAAPDAADLRRRLVTDFPDAPEMAEASLALARWEARSPRGVEEAIRLLEELIVAMPGAAVVPDARVELERLRGRGR